ncbi:hypothetical protein [Elioraea sp.]|uniref:hypothetical protein n=1 Tax=Elioraea sp. TaxID=2185103 RepID=UPI0021DE372A|nr:hypothetical protein [Elioraea sp.]GIX10376.1 MAG: hypothetical protein KatS3mg116_2086 [Elioraea sp.]
MITLNLSAEPCWIDLPHGVRLKLRPATTAIVSAAQARATRLAADAAAQFGAPDDDDLRRGFAFMLLVQTLARHLVLDWEGVDDAEGRALPLSAEAVERLMEHDEIAAAFWEAAMRPLRAVDAEGNA